MTQSETFISGKITRNISYASLPRQVLDVAVPQDINPQTPWVLMMHGGAWTHGNKRWIGSIQRMLLKNGIASVNINYRLAGPKSGYREQLEDITLAVAKMQEIRQYFGQTTGRYFVLGESAGGHLALLHGYQHATAVAGIVSLSGPTDFYTEEYYKGPFFRLARRVIEEITGGRYDQPNDTAVFKQASPVAQIAPVPTLLFQGTKDPIVDSSQGLTLARELQRQGMPYKLVLMQGAGHVPRLLPWKRPAIYREIRNWITENASR